MKDGHSQITASIKKFWGGSSRKRNSHWFNGSPVKQLKHHEISFPPFFLLFISLFYSLLPFFHVPFFSAVTYSDISSDSPLLSHIFSFFLSFKFCFYFLLCFFPYFISAAKQWHCRWVARLPLCRCSVPHAAAELSVICRERDLP